MSKITASYGGQLGTPLKKLATAANREHQRATESATHAIEHAVLAGEALAKARELCDYGSWADFIERHFTGSMRTAQKYIRIAKHMRMLPRNGDGSKLTSQEQASKALTAIMKGDEPTPKKSGSKQTRRARGAFVQEPSQVPGQALAILAEVRQRLDAMQVQNYHVRCASDMLRDGINRINALIDEERAAKNPPVCSETPNPEASSPVNEGGYDEVA